jgi:hypothetical protein
VDGITYYMICLCGRVWVRPPDVNLNGYFRKCPCGRPIEWMMLVSDISCSSCYSYEVDLQCFKGDGYLVIGDEKWME